jgi:hypothetical protein
MSRTGHYRLALHPNADTKQFEDYVTTVVFDETAALQLTRVTSSVQSTLLRATAEQTDKAHPGRQYIWQVAVETVNDMEYDFSQNVDRVQARLADYATLIGVEAFTNV